MVEQSRQCAPLRRRVPLFFAKFKPLLLLAVIVLLAGCRVAESERVLEVVATPTAVPLATLPLAATAAPLVETAVPRGSGDTVGFRTGTQPTATPLPPTPEGAGIPAGEAKQLFVPDAGEAPPEEWRPPPYAVPLAIHYDDHYWLARPLFQADRNFALDWYPFGNDVQLADIPSYRVHHGLDFPNDTGTPVLASADGTVVIAGAFPSPRDGVNYYGNTVVIEHDWQYQGGPVYTLYAHTLELFVQEGDRVVQGQLIAGVGSSGEVSGPHLHFEVRVGDNNYHNAQNPALWLAPFEGWGTIAGRFVDRRGRKIPGATLTLSPVDVETPVNARTRQTYAPGIASDPVWRENFVFGDVPAGTYELILDMNDNEHIYKREVTVYPGQTAFEIVSTSFDYDPTPTPLPVPTVTAVPEGTPEATPEEDGE